MKKRKDSFWGLHFDFHANPKDLEQGKMLCEEDIREIRKLLKPDFIQIDSKGHPGWTSFPSKLGNAVPDFKKNTLELFRRYVRRYTDAIHEKYPDFQVCSNWAFSDHLPVFVEDTFNSLSACMGPVAMILAGVTVARFNFVKMIKDKKVYLATLFRLVIIPTVIISALYGIKELSNITFKTSLDNSILYLTFFYVATPFGLNTIVFPESYGGDPKAGASMALISSTLCIVTIPLLYTLMEIIFK